MMYKKGDIVILKSRRYSVTACKCKVVDVQLGNVKEIEPIDGTTFTHGHFESKGRHYIVDGDTVTPFRLEFFSKDLFTL